MLLTPKEEVLVVMAERMEAMVELVPLALIQAAQAREPPPKNSESRTANFIPAAAQEAAEPEVEQGEHLAEATGRITALLPEEMPLTMDVAEAVLLEVMVATAIKALPLFETQGRQWHELCTH